MISVDTALRRVLASVNVLEPESKPVLECLGQVLASNIVSPFRVPPLDNSAMDGFAVISSDTIGAGYSHPIDLKVIGEVAAGSLFKRRVVRGTAVRIMTGAPVPKGADAVVPFEDTDETSRSHSDNKSGEIGIRKPVEPWVNIRRAGEDIPANHIVLRKGQTLKAADIGVLASLGIGTVKVVKRPLVAILATGNEVIEIGQRLPPGCIYNSNSYSLAASVTAAGGVPLLLGIARDEKKSLISSIRKGLNADFIMTTGGVSLGDYDLVKEILATEGEISFWTVRMKPGKPLAFGSFRRRNGNPIPHLGFPGNPVSSMISFELFGRPAIRKMLGMKEYRRPVVKAVLESTIRNRDRRRVFARVRVTRRDGGYRAVVTGDQGSGILTSMSLANGLAVIPETADAALPGALVDVMLIESEGLVA